MGRPKGSKNRAKKNDSTEANEDVAPGTHPESTTSGAASGEAGAAPAAGEPAALDAVDASTKAVVTPQDGGLDEHRATPAKRDLTQTIDEMHALIRKLWRDRAAEKEDASADAKMHSDEIKRIEAEIDSTIRSVEDAVRANAEEIVHYDRGIVEYRDRTTGKVLYTRTIVAADSQAKLPFDKPSKPPPPPTPTFDKLQDGKTWEHDHYGVVRILAVLEASVRVQTEDLDEGSEGIEIGVADWNAQDAYPREVPALKIGQRWTIDDHEHIIIDLDDRAACVIPYSGAEDLSGTFDRVSRLSFCASDAKQIIEDLWASLGGGVVVRFNRLDAEGNPDPDERAIGRVVSRSDDDVPADEQTVTIHDSYDDETFDRVDFLTRSPEVVQMPDLAVGQSWRLHEEGDDDGQGRAVTITEIGDRVVSVTWDSGESGSVPWLSLAGAVRIEDLPLPEAAPKKRGKGKKDNAKSASEEV